MINGGWGKTDTDGGPMDTEHANIIERERSTYGTPDAKPKENEKKPEKSTEEKRKHPIF